MVDNNVRHSLSLLHINKCNLVDILFIEEPRGADDDCPKEEYMETTAPVVNEDLFTPLSCPVDDLDNRRTADVLLESSSLSSSDKELSLVDIPVAMFAPSLSAEPLFRSTIDPNQPNNVQSAPQTLTNASTAEELAAQLERICRCCLSTQRDLQPIFDTENCIPDMIMALAAGVQLVPDDSLPAHICMPCVLQLSRALTFKQQLETADVTLREFCSDGGYARGMKLPSSLDADAVATETNVASTAASDVAVAAEESKSHTQHHSEHVDYVGSDSEFANTTHTLLDLSTNASDILIDHVLESNVIDDDDFIRLAHPPGESLDTMHHMQLLDSNAHTELFALPIKLTLSANCGDVESLLQPMAADQQQPVAKTYGMDGDDEEDDEEDDDDQEDDREEMYTIEPVEDVDFEVDFPHQLEATFEDITIADTNFTADNDNDFPAATLKASAWACFMCDKEYSDAVKLRRHQRTHDADKTNVCRVCHKAFHLHSELQRHEKRHIHKKAANQFQGGYPCGDCSLSFNMAGDLRVHRSLHTCTDGRYLCAGCDKQLDCKCLFKFSQIG